MRTELPAERMRRRLSAEPDPTGPDAEAEPSSDDTTDTSLSRWLPEHAGGQGPGWAGAIRADPGRAGVIALGVVGLIAVLVTVFSLASHDDPRVIAANLPAVQPVSSSGPVSSPPSPAPDATVIVSVVGLVRTPGLVTLTPSARIADALEAAGGPLDGADVTGLNMARRVNDGEQIIVGLASPPGTPSAMGSSVTTPPGGAAPEAGQPSSAPNTPIDLNAATVEQLDALPGVGPVTATAITAWRTANGRFTSIEQLGEVDGIGPARLEKLRALVHV